MMCPACNHTRNTVTDKRNNQDSSVNRRRRKCLNCGHKWSTIEVNILRERSQTLKVLGLEHRKQILEIVKRDVRIVVGKALDSIQED